MSPVFTLHPEPRVLEIASTDSVTTAAASGGLLWVGTQSGRLIRYDTHTNQVDEVRGRLGVGRLDNAVWRIYAESNTHAVLIILRNADCYHAHSVGPVRPRWLARLRGLRCVSASWIRVSSRTESRSVALLGTALGALFSLRIDEQYEKDDVLSKLWSAPNGEKIDGIRVEYAAEKYVGTVATTSTLYLFSGATALTELFDAQRMSVVKRVDPLPQPAPNVDILLPSELQFMTGKSGLASRRFVWASSIGVTHAQLAVRRRRSPQPRDTESTPDSPLKSTVVASVVDKETISWANLKAKSGSAVPLAVNLSAFHVLVLYPASVYAFNYISGELTQTVTLWSPTRPSAFSEQPAEWSRTRRRLTTSTSSERSAALRARESDGQARSWEQHHGLLSSPASGFARDVFTDMLWVYTSDGEFARVVSSSEEQIEAWKAAKAMGRFDLAMALAPLLSSGLQDDTTVLQTREAVLEAQADHAAMEGNWDIAAQLFAKTNRPVEAVILSIIDAESRRPATEHTSLSALGIGSRSNMVKHVITYLVRKLDRMDSSRPMQRTILATLLVQLYATQLSSKFDPVKVQEVREDFGHFLADRHEDLDTSTAFNILVQNDCFEEAWSLAVMSGEVLLASEHSSRLGDIDQTLALLKNQRVVKDEDLFGQLVSIMSMSLLPLAPHKIMTFLSRVLKKDSQNIDQISVAQGLARVARELGNGQRSHEAYESCVAYLYDLLHDCKVVVAKRSSSNRNTSDDNSSQNWFNLISFLFQLYAEFGTEEEAQRSFEHLVVPYVRERSVPQTAEALGAILRSAQMAGFRKLCVSLYQALSLHQTAISEAVAIDSKLAESKVAQLSLADIPSEQKKSLWCLVASQSEDPVGVVERSKGVLHIEDVLKDMPKFEYATDRIKAAVADSLEKHKRLANAAKNEALSALEVITSLRDDLTRARVWQRDRYPRRHRPHSQAFSCGHRTKATPRTAPESAECALCGDKVIDSIDAPFDTGHILPTRVSEDRTS